MSVSKPQRVLVVDDDPVVRLLLQQHLTDDGYETVCASSGAEAIPLLLSTTPSVVIADWLMPEMDGLELCRAIRNHDGIPTVFVIIVTAHQTSEDRIVEAFDAGADDFLTKPFKKKELLARVRAGARIIELQRALQRRTRDVHRTNAEMAIVNEKLNTANERLKLWATTDELTGLANRRQTISRLDEAWSVSQRTGDPLACIVIDIDHFKNVNDTYGHGVGDLVLKEVADVLRRAARRHEPVCRLGGEEFVVLCPNATATQAAAGAERMRQAVEARIVHTDAASVSVTISLGVAEYDTSMSRPDDLLQAADVALYNAKHSGRNRVCVAGVAGDGGGDATKGVHARAETRVSPKHNPGDGPAGRVLVVDNDDDARTACRGFLEKAGFAVEEAKSGEEALQNVHRLEPHTVVTDIALPGMDGVELTRELKGNAETSHISVLLLSTSSDARDAARGLEAGVDDYVCQPYRSDDLVLRVRTLQRVRQEQATQIEMRGEQSRALGILADFARQIATCGSLDEVLDRTLSAVTELTCASRACVLLPDQGRQWLSVAKSLGFDEEQLIGIRLRPGAAMVGRVFKEQETITLDAQTAREEHVGGVDALLMLPAPSLAVPLAAPESVVGVLQVGGRPRGHPFSPLDLEYVALVSNISAPAIDDVLNRKARDDARDSIVIALAKLAEYRDSATGRHLDRVTQFSLLLADDLHRRPAYATTITNRFMSDLERAAPLHDIGKVAVPDQILLKPDRLLQEEVERIQTHTTIGASTIRSVMDRAPGTTFLPMAEEIARSHHEWYDGRGYPDGLMGETIPLSARIVAVADVYDAVTTKRVYKDAMSHERAMEIIGGASGQQFDPEVVEAFRRCEADFVRLAAELGDGENTLPHTDAMVAALPALVGPSSQAT